MDNPKNRCGMGWIPDYPDFRDYTEKTDEVKSILGSARGVKTKGLPASVDLRSWCSPVEDQGSLGSCTAHAGVGMIEYYERKSFGKHIDASRLFLYKVTRNLMKMKGDTGAYLRTTMGPWSSLECLQRRISHIQKTKKSLTKSLLPSVMRLRRIIRPLHTSDTILPQRRQNRYSRQ